ncbi:MAG: glycogen/starch/alpha-glucan phosphorylase [Anaeroplasma sp.]|nr:glycogen/starch/alpha-glucan phosphorylase [Anaeroplasma sp.]
MNYPNFKDVKTFKQAFISNVENKYAVDFENSTPYQQYVVLGEMLRYNIAKDWHNTNQQTKIQQKKVVYYFSMEFLMGRMITNNLMNAGVYPIVKQAFDELGIDLNEVEHQETDAGLGNGGLGRLAACFMDSVASLGLPVHGNCIRYRYGFFEQGIRNGYQVEHPDRWLKDVNVWEIRKDEDAVEIPFFGYIDMSTENGKLHVRHKDAEYIKAVPYDIPIIGDGNHVVNTLRLWSAEPASVYPQNEDAFEYHRKLREISSMLYPNDDTEEGKMLRLKQQYFFVSAGVVNAIRRHKKIYNTVRNLDKKVVFHINDTHPALIVPELMRILVDEEHLEWSEAWNITKNCCAYTNHTILAEALEKWPVHLFKKLLPRIYTITEEINRRLLIEIAEKYGDNSPQAYQMAIIKDNRVHMAHMAIHGSFSVNGVAQLHTDILKNIEMKVFSDYYPGKFNNKTNGITHRRWCLHSNPELVEILKNICPNWVKDPENELKKLLEYADDEKLQQAFAKMKLARKNELANKIYTSQGVSLDTNSIFDVQVKRLHEYKRQLMNALHIMYVYNRLKSDPEFKKNYHPHSFIFGAKSAPGYYFAKKVIKLINTIADKVNNDEETNHLLKVVFVVNYNVTYAETIMPAANVSEQISTASKEASGTGNMKFMMNGAITCGTLDGANVEIANLVGDDNIVIFGMNAKEVTDLYAEGGYNPMDIYNSDPRIHQIIDQLTNGFFEKVDIHEFDVIRENLLSRDNYFILKDFASYVEAQEKINELYKDQKKWLRMSIINTAMSGFFTTDRTMLQYNEDIWHTEPIKL